EGGGGGVLGGGWGGVGGGGQGGGVGVAGRVARLDWLRLEEREDRDAFARVRVGQRLAAHLEQSPARRGQGPLSAGVALHLDAVAYHRCGQPLAGFLFVQVSRIDGEQVDLVPRRGQDDLRGGLGQPSALLNGDLRRGVADVGAEDLAPPAPDGGPAAPLGDPV